MHLGERYVKWLHYREPRLGEAEKADAYEQFAKEFGEMSRHLEPYSGWAETMAYCCRRLAMRSRGEEPGEWALVLS